MNPLIVLVAINWVVFAVLFVLWLKAAATSPTIRLRTLGRVGALVSVVFLMGATQRLGIHLSNAGLLPERVTADLISAGQAVLSILITVVIGVAVYTMSRFGREVMRADRMVSILSSRLPEGLSVHDLGLTGRELEVLEWMSEGRMSDVEIATAMSISPATAGTHVRNILKKAGISSRSDLVVFASQDTGGRGAYR